MATATEIQTRLTEAETALHNLATGASVVEVMRDGRKVRYTQSKMSELQSYVDWLRAELDAAELVALGKPRRRAIGIAWKN